MATVLVESADTLLDDFDPARYLSRLADHCVEFLGARGAGVTLLESDGRPVPAAHSSERPELVKELLEAGRTSGPTHDSLKTGKPVPPVDLASEAAAMRWPVFTAVALRHDITTTYAVPLRQREILLGAISVFTPQPTTCTGGLAIAQTLADAAAVGLLNHRAYAQYRTLAGQLRSALASRVRIEQAKGMLAERWRATPDSAFTTLRQYARSKRLPLDQVARAVVHRALPEDELHPGKSGPA
ncbi:ANTAR domain-containing protein [Streptomyces sp. KL116D]|uniref:ANTAR domain-containing protein n=1 Tax=Streptomyces sp. KL116D TaxID=3045152 RepID=UPI003558810F